MKVLAFAASNSENSINRYLVTYAAKMVKGGVVELLDLNDFEMPIFSPERELKLGVPEQATLFFNKITEADVIIISFAEHNGSYTAAYKNLFDWVSRIDMKVYQGKPILMLATSPGPGGAANVLSSSSGSAAYFAADLKATLSIPRFFDNFDIEKGLLTNADMNAALIEAIAKLVD